MANTYNLYNLEAPFKEYLLAGNNKPVSIKNYLSDFRHFAGWVTFVIASTSMSLRAESNNLGVNSAKQSQEIASSSSTPRYDIGSFITADTIEKYKSYLSENNIPFKTINRRLSTIRKFCSFCISQGWMKENPAKRVSNVLLSRATLSEAKESRGTRDDILNQFEQHLVKENLDKKTIISFLDDVREFLAI